MNHLFYIFNDRVAGVKTIDHFFIMVRENFLQNIHAISMKQNGAKSNPLMNEGAGGVDVP